MDEKIKKERINSEIKRITALFESAAENQKKVLSPLIQNSAFMRVTLEDLQEIINRDGVIDEYRNGANQYGTKQSATLQSYNALVKNYTIVQKQLLQLLPKETKGGTLEEFLQQIDADLAKEAKKEDREEG